MSDILGRFAQSESHFRPQTVSEFIALQLARKLDDTSRVRHYVGLMERHAQPFISRAFANARQRPEDPIADRFHRELQQLTHTEADE